MHLWQSSTVTLAVEAEFLSQILASLTVVDFHADNLHFVTAPARMVRICKLNTHTLCKIYK